jgi:hypothetical protein
MFELHRTKIELSLYQISFISEKQFWKYNMGANRCIQFIGFVKKRIRIHGLLLE